MLIHMIFDLIILFSHLFDATKRIDIEIAAKIKAYTISAIDLIGGHAILIKDGAIGHRVH